MYSTMKIAAPVALATALLALLLVPAALAGGKKDPGCTVSAAQVQFGQDFTVSAYELPSTAVDLIFKSPNAGWTTQALPVNSNGTYAFTFNSNMVGGYTPGTYSFQFVSKVSWPAGTYRTSYAFCSVYVS